MKLRLPADVASSQDLVSLIAEIRDYSRWFSHESIKNHVDVEHVSNPPIMSPAATEIIYELGAKKTTTQQSLADLIEELEQYNHKAPSITLILAAPPTNGIKTTLVNWCRKNIAPNIMVTFQFNTTLLGGMVVRYGSRVFDWSFRRQLLAARERIPEVIRRV
jgi:hypothetical protein